jgi:hypothetical protein
MSNIVEISDNGDIRAESNIVGGYYIKVKVVCSNR